jgi:ABC-type sugar transport system ATPase subunit
MAGVRLEHVSKQFNNNPVLKDIELTIPDGIFCVILGPSGCGKSTLLNLIAGLEQVSEGKVFLGEVDVTRTAPQKRNIAMVFQSYALYPHLSVFENIAFGLRARGEKETLVRAKVDECCNKSY